MNHLKIILVLVSFCIVLPSSFSQTKLMSYNIRYASPNDGEDLWDLRKEELVNMLSYYQPDFIGLQEVTPKQLAFIAQDLETHKHIGYGRDGKDTDSEAAPIFYDQTKYELVDYEMIWLSETPSEISKGWDAALNRIAVYGTFKHKATNQIVHIINTHFDHRGEHARLKSAELLVNIVKKRNVENEKVVLMGDLNCLPTEAPYEVLKKEFDDSYKIKAFPVYGPVTTWNGFDMDNKSTRRIDYLLTKNIHVQSYRCVDDRRNNNRHLSDHFPVLIECDLQHSNK